VCPLADGLTEQSNCGGQLPECSPNSTQGQIIAGSLRLSVNGIDALVLETPAEQQVFNAALSAGIASSLQGVDAYMVQILSVRAARRLEALGDWVWGAALASRRLTAGTVMVDYKIRIPQTPSTPDPMTASIIMDAFNAGLISGIRSAMQAKGISIDVRSISASPPMISLGTVPPQNATSAEEEPTRAGNSDEGTPSRSTTYSRAFELFAVLVLIAVSC